MKIESRVSHRRESAVRYARSIYANIPCTVYTTSRGKRSAESAALFSFVFAVRLFTESINVTAGIINFRIRVQRDGPFGLSPYTRPSDAVSRNVFASTHFYETREITA